MMNSYEKFVGGLARLYAEGKGFELGNLPKPARAAVREDAPKALIFSPHPDDEVVIGALALRLLREAGWKVLNVAVTQGSNKARQEERWRELAACCDYMGFGLVRTGPNGLEGINPEARARDPAGWARSVERIGEILLEHRPRVILFPHDDDWNSTHIGTHWLLRDALERVGEGVSCYTVETEFWGAMDRPNLMVESSEQDVSDLISGLTFHVGEVRRNPYHLRLPAWLIDNVRRGGELVGEQGGAPPDFLFGTLYRLREWRGGQWRSVLERGKFLSCSDEAAGLFG